MKPAPKSCPASVATSPAIPGRRIGRVNGPERARLVFFAKKPSNFTEINPQSRPFEWAGLPPARACFPPNLDLTGPNSARRRFSIFLRICYLSKTIEIL